MDQLDALREAYAHDEIDLDTFEQFVGWLLEGRAVVLPRDLTVKAILKTTARPGGYFVYDNPPF